MNLTNFGDDKINRSIDTSLIYVSEKYQGNKTKKESAIDNSICEELNSRTSSPNL